MHGAEAIRSDESMCADTVWYVICVALASKGALYLCFEYVYFPIFLTYFLPIFIRFFSIFFTILLQSIFEIYFFLFFFLF